MVDNQHEFLARDDLDLGPKFGLVRGKGRDDSVPDDALGSWENILHELGGIDDIQREMSISKDTGTTTGDTFPSIFRVYKLNICVHGFALNK